MPTYLIETKVVIGYYCMGAAVIESGHAYLKLTDKEVSDLKDLAQKLGTYNIKKMKLAEVYPKIYDKLEEAYNNAAQNAAEWHWNKEAWENRNGDEYVVYDEYDDFENEYDYKVALRYAISHLGYKPNSSRAKTEKGKKRHFEKWLDNQIKNHRSEKLERLLDKLFLSEPEYAELDEEIQLPDQLIKDMGF